MGGLSPGSPFHFAPSVATILFIYVVFTSARTANAEKSRSSAASDIFSERMADASSRASSFAESAAQWIGFAGDAVRHRIADMERRAREQPAAQEPATKQDLVARFWQHLNRTSTTPPGETTERNFGHLFAAHMKLVRLLERKGFIDAGEAESVRPKQLCSIIEEHKSLFAPCTPAAARRETQGQPANQYMTHPDDELRVEDA